MLLRISETDGSSIQDRIYQKKKQSVGKSIKRHGKADHIIFYENVKYIHVTVYHINILMYRV